MALYIPFTEILLASARFGRAIWTLERSQATCCYLSRIPFSRLHSKIISRHLLLPVHLLQQRVEQIPYRFLLFGYSTGLQITAFPIRRLKHCRFKMAWSGRLTPERMRWQFILTGTLLANAFLEYWSVRSKDNPNRAAASTEHPRPTQWPKSRFLSSMEWHAHPLTSRLLVPAMTKCIDTRMLAWRIVIATVLKSCSIFKQTHFLTRRKS